MENTLISLEKRIFLNEIMGLCWHDWQDRYDGTSICKKCQWDTKQSSSYREFLLNNKKWRYPIDFETWNGFGELWEWSNKQKWYFDFKKTVLYKGYFVGYTWEYDFDFGYINPKRFSEAVYIFLTSKRNPLPLGNGGNDV